MASDEVAAEACAAKVTSPAAVIVRLVVDSVLSLTTFKPRAMPTAAAPPEAAASALVAVVPVWVAVAEKSPVRVSPVPLPMSALVSVLDTAMLIAPPMPTPLPPAASPPAVALVEELMTMWQRG